jgi:hypothetical protein
MNISDVQALAKFLALEDWMEMKINWDHHQAANELDRFPRDTWPRYNPRKPIERYCLDLTQIPGGNDNVSSLGEYNRANGTDYKNHDFTEFTDVYHQLPEMQKVLEPFKSHIGRSHIIRIDAGGYFPPHYDTIVPDETVYDVRLVAAIKNVNRKTFKWLHDNPEWSVPLNDGDVYIVNTAKPHSVFSFVDDATILVANLRFDKYLLERILELYKYG